jgi:hypothetical protein
MYLNCLLVAMGHRGTGRRRRSAFGGALLCAAMVVGLAPPASALVTADPRDAVTFNDVVRTVVFGGDTIYVGGLFTTATDSSGTTTRNHVAAVSATTGQLLEWNPNADRPVHAIAVAGDAVYLGGEFSQVGGVNRRKLAKVSGAGNGAVAGDFVHTANLRVSAMTVLGGSLYVGGQFGTVDGRTRTRLAAFDLATENLRDDWTPSANAAVATLAGDTDRVYAGGKFTGLNGRSSAAFLAAVDAADGGLDVGFDPSISYRVSDLEVSGAAVYAAADGPGGHLRAFEQAGGDNLWDLPTDGGVQGVTEIGGTVYFGGHFDRACQAARSTPGSCRAGDVSRRKLAAADTAGNLLSWAPQGNSNLGVVALDSRSPEQVAAGGAFTRFQSGRFVRPHFALFG